MRKYKFIGTFKSAKGHTYQLETTCFSLLEAFFCLTADAIRNGSHYQLDTIVNEEGRIVKVDDILKCNNLLN